MKTLPEKIEEIIGHAIGHGYNDGRADKKKIDVECKQDAQDFKDQSLAAFREYVEEKHRELKGKPLSVIELLVLQEFEQALLSGLTEEI